MNSNMWLILVILATSTSNRVPTTAESVRRTTKLRRSRGVPGPRPIRRARPHPHRTTRACTSRCRHLVRKSFKPPYTMRSRSTWGKLPDPVWSIPEVVQQLVWELPVEQRMAGPVTTISSRWRTPKRLRLLHKLPPLVMWRWNQSTLLPAVCPNPRDPRFITIPTTWRAGKGIPRRPWPLCRPHMAIQPSMESWYSSNMPAEWERLALRPIQVTTIRELPRQRREQWLRPRQHQHRRLREHRERLWVLGRHWVPVSLRIVVNLLLRPSTVSNPPHPLAMPTTPPCRYILTDRIYATNQEVNPRRKAKARVIPIPPKNHQP